MLSARRPPTMSTLLEIKSSVLRQVQVCPSFRRRTEEEPASSSTEVPEPAAGAWWVPHSPLRMVTVTCTGTPLPSLTSHTSCPAWPLGGAQEALNPRPWGASYLTPRHAETLESCGPARAVSCSFGEGLLTPSLGFLGRKPGDGVEFFAQMRLILKKGESRQGLPCPEVRIARALLPGMGCWARPPHLPLRPPLPPSLEHSAPHWPREPQRPSPGALHRSSCAVAPQPPQSPWTPAVALEP